MSRSQYPIVCVRLGPHVLARLDQVLIAKHGCRRRGDRTCAISIALSDWMEREERNARKRRIVACGKCGKNVTGRSATSGRRTSR